MESLKLGGKSGSVAGSQFAGCIQDKVAAGSRGGADAVHSLLRRVHQRSAMIRRMSKGSWYQESPMSGAVGLRNSGNNHIVCVRIDSGKGAHLVSSGSAQHLV